MSIHKLSASVVLLSLMVVNPVLNAGKAATNDSQLSKKTQSELLRYSGKSSSKGVVCGTDNNNQNWDLIQKQRAQNLKNKFSVASSILQNIKSKQFDVKDVSGKGVSGRYYIPVVFHVYGAHYNCDNGGTCLTDAKIIDALNRTNEDFLGLNSQDGPIDPEFQAIRENLNVEFVLAKKDPSGNATNGIVRYADKSGYGNGDGADAQIAADAWDNFKYMNVYIQRDLYADGDTNNSGVAWYPQLSMTQAKTSRVVYNGNFVGSNTSENFRSVLTHEFGHWLNLPHVFDGDVCSVHQETFCSITGDRVCDTPQIFSSSIQGNTLNCLGKKTNTENFMHYSDNYAMFTQGQVKRMIAALNSPSRATLWTNSNLINAGLNDLTSNDGHPWDGTGGDIEPEGTVLKEVNNLSAVKGNVDIHTFDAPANTEALAIYLDGFLEDPDMYVKKGSAPTKSGETWNADFISFRSIETPEFVAISSPTSAQTYYTAIDAFTDYSNARLRFISADDPTLAPGHQRIFLSEEKNIGALKGSGLKSFQFDIPQDATRTVVVLPGGYTGDPDMYVSMNSVPTTDSFDCGPFSAPTLAEYCEFSAGGGSLNIIIEPFLDYSNAILRVYYERPVTSSLPTAEANGPYQTTLGNSISFSSAGSVDSDGSIVGYLWEFGDGNSSSVSSPSHTYTTAGSFNVNLTVTDNDGQTGSDTATVTVNSENIAPTAKANGPYTANVNQTIDFNSSGSNDGDGTIVSYFWDFEDGTTSSVANPSHAYSVAGTYNATLTVTDNNGLTGQSNASVTINDVTTNYCDISGNTRYEWISKVKVGSFENTSAKEGYGDFTSLTIPVTTGTNSIELTSEGGYNENFSVWIDLNGDGTFNNSDEKVLSNLSGKGTLTGSMTIPSGHEGKTTRMRVVMKYSSEATSACGSLGDGEAEDYSVSISSSGNVAPIARVNGPYSGTVNHSIHFSSSGSTDSDGTITHYSWEFGDGATSNEANPSHVYSQDGSFNVKLTVTDNDGASHSSNTQVTVAPASGGGTLPNVCDTGSPVTSGRIQAGEPVCLGSSNTIWLSMADVSSHQSVAISTGHGQGNLDVYYKNGGWPSESSNDAQSTGSTNTECIYLDAGTQYWSYLKIKGSSGGATILLEFDSAACQQP